MSKTTYKYTAYSLDLPGGTLKVKEGKTFISVSCNVDEYTISKNMPNWEAYSEKVIEFLADRWGKDYLNNESRRNEGL